MSKPFAPSAHTREQQSALEQLAAGAPAPDTTTNEETHALPDAR